MKEVCVDLTVKGICTFKGAEATAPVAEAAAAGGAVKSNAAIIKANVKRACNRGRNFALLQGGPERAPAAVSERSLVIGGLVTSERLPRASKSEKGTSCLQGLSTTQLQTRL